jgi:hypothetical protein
MHGQLRGSRASSRTPSARKTALAIIGFPNDIRLERSARTEGTLSTRCIHTQQNERHTTTRKRPREFSPRTPHCPHTHELCPLPTRATHTHARARAQQYAYLHFPPVCTVFRARERERAQMYGARPALPRFLYGAVTVRGCPVGYRRIYGILYARALSVAPSARSAPCMLAGGNYIQ